MQPTAPAVISDLAPTGKLRVAINLSNFLLTNIDATSGEYGGVAVDLGRELARQLGVALEIVPFPNPGALADAANSNAWDVGFLAAEPQRAKEIAFTAAYVEIEATYLVPPGSTLASIAEVDRAGVRIGVASKTAYDLYLSRSLRHATLVREKGADNAFMRYFEDKLDALAGLRPRLVTDQPKQPGSRILDGGFTAIQQAAGTPVDRANGARYLRDFIEEVKSSGVVAKAIAAHGVRGLTLAAASKPR